MAEERLDEIRELRLKKRQSLIDSQAVPYPTEARRSHDLATISKAFAQLKADETPVTVAGRLTGLRKHGGVAFLDLADESGQLQLQISRDHLPEEIFNRQDILDTGDFIEAAGILTVTTRGVNTLLVNEFHLLSKSIRPLPSAWYGLKDQETRYRQREVDLLLNPDVKKSLVLRSQVISWLRQYFANLGFLEVETPILQTLAGGATATPFITHHDALDIPLYLRIAPELYLKRLLVGGFEKVFELGRNFRNEGIDREHNPEFTMCELYWAYADYEDLMDMTSNLLSKLITNFFGSPEIVWQEHTLSFKDPLPRKSYVEIVSEKTGFDILTEKNPAAYLAIFKKHRLDLPTIQTYAKLVDELFKELIRPNLIQPIILYDYPTEMVPLAKQKVSDPRIVERFQPIAGGMELMNGFSELNDPVEQRQRFAEQQTARDQGDTEAQVIDEDYIRALEYGMPPAAGVGIGIDRLASVITNASSVRDTIAFPLLKPEV